MTTARRTVLKKMVGGAACLALPPTIIPASALARGGVAPNSKITIGAIGVGRMGSVHLSGFLQHPDVRLVAVCDVQQSRREAAKATVDQYYGDTACATYSDFRELLARPDIDGIVNATTEHWHALISMEAARRGKHIYHEKSMATTIAECRALRDSVHRFGVVFQLGTQQRSTRDYRFTCELIRNGRIGELQTVMIASPGGGRAGPALAEVIQAPPRGFDYDMWLGPAPWTPYSDERVSLTWQWISDYGHGSMDGCWGVHDLDIAQWVNDADSTGPVEVEAAGKYFTDLRDAAYAWTAEYKYANGVRLIHMDMAAAKKLAPQFGLINFMSSVMVGSEGWILVSRNGMRTHPASLMQAVIGANEKRVMKSDDHRRNFLEAIRSGSRTICDVDTAVRTTTVSQQALIAMKLGRRLRWDPREESFIGDPAANRMMTKPMRSPWRM
jgi:predicted dehydrogenase